MNRTEHLGLMARYNQWMNAKLYNAAMSLPEGQIVLDRQAFFGSILGTLNHLLAGDTIWLKRFAQHPTQYAALAPLQQVALPQDLKTLL
ncbi:DinB family protein, partial [Pseudomonas protegens]